MILTSIQLKLKKKNVPISSIEDFNFKVTVNTFKTQKPKIINRQFSTKPNKFIN